MKNSLPTSQHIMPNKILGQVIIETYYDFPYQEIMIIFVLVSGEYDCKLLATYTIRVSITDYPELRYQGSMIVGCVIQSI